MSSLESTPPSPRQFPEPAALDALTVPAEAQLKMPKPPSMEADLEQPSTIAGTALPVHQQPDKSAGAKGVTASAVRSCLTASEIDARMAKDGFAEMQILWERFKKMDVPLETLDPEKITLQRDHHMAPLLGRPMMTSLACAAAGILSAYQMSSNVLQHLPGVGPVLRAALAGLTAINGGILAVYGTTLVQRYLLNPMAKLMASDLAFMLKLPNFREWFEETPRAKAASAKLRAHGINEIWDNPSYKARYACAGDEVKRFEVETHHQYVQRILREFLGFKDPERRKFVEGRYIHDLIEEKRSVTRFVNNFQAQITANREGKLPAQDGLSLLRTLLADYVVANSHGARVLKESIECIERGDYLSGHVVEAHVWDRDPWVDLTHQEEFYSSASLRGAKLMGRGPKGRVGPFAYHYNKSISALDFNTKKGRIVRARCAAAVRENHGEPQTVLLVDGIEGSNALNPAAALRAIEDYAAAAGFSSVLYNKYVYNQIPKRFVNAVAERGVPLEEMRLRFIDDSRREYLDALGIPIEPFEYSYPRGTFVGYKVALKESKEQQPNPPGTMTNVLQFLRRNSLWLLLGEATAFSGAMMWKSTPAALLPWTAILGAAVYIHFRFQNRSVRDRG